MAAACGSADGRADDRATAITQAKVSKLSDRAENPEETLDFSYEQQLVQLQNVKRRRAALQAQIASLQAQDQQLAAQEQELIEGEQALAAKAEAFRSQQEVIKAQYFGR